MPSVLLSLIRGVCSVMIIFVGNGHSELSSNPE